MKSGDVSTLNIGSRLPVVTSGVAGNGVITESVTMLDLGLRINIGAQVLDENNVNFDVGLNVSHLLRETESARGTSQPHLTTRDIDTSLVVKDGETAMLGGITSLSNRRQLDGIPGLARNPLTVVAGGANENSEVKNDLLILITPEILLNSSGDIYAGGASVYGNEVNPGLNAAMSRALESYLNSSAQPRTPVTPTRGRPPVRR
jgi:general secretion pathway protein D